MHDSGFKSFNNNFARTSYHIHQSPPFFLSSDQKTIKIRNIWRQTHHFFYLNPISYIILEILSQKYIKIRWIIELNHGKHKVNLKLNIFWRSQLIKSQTSQAFVKWIKEQYNQQLMSDQQVAFDNWEEEAELALTSTEPISEPVKQELKEQKQPVVLSQQARQEEKKKQDIIDSHTKLLLKLGEYKQINQDKFDNYLQEKRKQSTNEEILISNQILKSDKDFVQFAKKAAKRFSDKLDEEGKQNLQDNNLVLFIQEIVLLTYNQLEWKNIETTKEKLRIVKKEKKDQQAKARKQKEKEQRQKKQGKTVKEEEEEQSTKKQVKAEDDIFGGATLVNSKQVEDEIKNKTIQKVQQPAKKVEEDDDDFM